MKKFFVVLGVAVAMMAAVSCACNNGSDNAGCDKTECADCADCGGCTKAEDTCCDAEGACDDTCDKHCDKKCDKHDGKQCGKHGEGKACCDSTSVDCRKK